MLLNNLTFSTRKYPVAFVYIALGWQLLEVADVFIDRYQLSEMIFVWVSIIILLGLLLFVAYNIAHKRMEVKVLLVDDHVIVRSGLKMLLEKNTKYKVAGEANNGYEALNLMQSNNYDIVFTDLSMPVMNGISLCKNIQENHDNAKVMAFTMRDDKTAVKQMLAAGASGFLLKSCGLKEIESAIDTVLQGGSYFSSNLEAV